MHERARPHDANRAIIGSTILPIEQLLHPVGIGKGIEVVAQDILPARLTEPQHQHGRNASAVHASRAVKEDALVVGSLGHKREDLAHDLAVLKHGEVAVGHVALGVIRQLEVVCVHVIGVQLRMQAADAPVLGQAIRGMGDLPLAAKVDVHRDAVVT